MRRGRPAGGDLRLVAAIAIGQTIGWGTLFSVFPLFVAPMEAALGWSRAAVNAGLTLALLTGGLAAVPVGRFVDRRGGRWMLALGGFAGAALLGVWALIGSLAGYWLLWAAFGLAHAAALWGPAMAVVVARARDAGRAITGITFVTGLTATIFVPLGALLIDALGWRGALLALAAIQLLPGIVTLWLLPPDPPRPATAPRAGFRLAQAVRRPVFLLLALALSAHSFIGIGLGAHAIPLLRERGLPEASVLLVAALHGPFQVVARAALFALGPRVTMRGVGRLASAMVPIAMVVLAVAPPSLPWLLVYAVAWAVADGLMTIVRAAGVAEILGREGYGALTGALSVATMPPRALAPVLIALVWEAAGGYGPVPWMLAALGLVSALAFHRAAALPGDVR